MADSFKHKLEGKQNRFKIGMRALYEQGILYSDGYRSIYDWPVYLLGPEPLWFRYREKPSAYEKRLCNRRHRRVTRDLLSMARFDNLPLVHRWGYWW